MSQVAAHKFGRRLADFWSERKKEIFFAGVAIFALGQVAHREYQLSQRNEELRQRTPQQQGGHNNTKKVVQVLQSREDPYAPKAEWTWGKKPSS